MHKFGDATITTGADVDTIVFDWGKIQMLSTENVTGSKSISFGSVMLEPGKGHIRHNHPDADEIIYFVSGEGDQMLNDGDPVRCTAGACCWIPKGVYHSTINRGAGALHLVVAYIPAGSEQALYASPDVTIIPAETTT
ncbi:MAG: cupin domain-containing protein [Chloroflexota bacterium]|nr:cupin domain-containing protein [Chloroflexota bacterium]